MPHVILLAAFDDLTALFRVVRDGDDGWRFKIVSPEGDREIALASPEFIELLRQTNRLELHQQPLDPAETTEMPKLFALPCLRPAARLVFVDHEGRRAVKVSGLVRCFFKDEDTARPHAAVFDLTFAPPAGAGYRPALIAVAQWHRLTGGFRKRNISLRHDTIAGEFSFEDDGVGGLSEITGKLGIVPTGGTRVTMGIALVHLPGDAEAAPFVLQFRITARRVGVFRCVVPAFDLDFTDGTLELIQRPAHALPPATDATPHWTIELKVERHFDTFRTRFNERVSEPIHRALRAVRAGQPLSLLPRLERLKQLGADEWWVVWSLHGELREIVLEDAAELIPAPLHETNDFAPRGPVLVPLRAIEPGGEWLVEAQFLAFRVAATGTPLRLPLLLRRGKNDRIGDLAREPEVLLQLAEVRTKEPTGALLLQQVRLGAIELTFGTPERLNPAGPIEFELTDLAGREHGALRFAVRTIDLGPGLPVPSPVVPELRLPLGVHAVAPAAQDALPGEEFAELFQINDEEYERFFRRESPLVIDPARSPAPVTIAEPSPFWIDTRESALTTETQTVDLQLHRVRAPAAETRRLWIFDAEPLLIAEVRFGDLFEDIISGTTTEIANFSTRSGAAWEISAGARGFTLALPPQGVGETMEKNETEVAAPGPPGERDDVREGEVIAFRFTPLALFEVQPAYFRQRFAEPPWNLRRLLGFPGQRDPGMALDRFRFELLYGLAGRVEHRGLRLAEILARIGAPAGRQSRAPLWRATGDQDAEFQRHRLAWAGWFSLLQSRLGVLEPWAHEQGEADLRLSEDVSFELRRTARLKFPVATPLKKLAAAPHVPPETYEPNASDPSDVPLPGGFAWAFESINLYDALWRLPQSDSAELHRPYFSALGGWGFQKATFDRGLFRLYSDTAMGRTFSFTLERLGRISIGWHLAKHVIVYERTVLPARQFYNEANKEQDALRGRAVLRKVREYVEILELLRRFPDDASAPIERGCLLGIEFPEGGRRINVTSRWGQDVGTPADKDAALGWKVPLWVRGALPVDIYPKPQILALFQQAQGDAPIRVEIDEPEKLYFFTSTRIEDAPDPHAWAPVQGVDFTWVPEPAANEHNSLEPAPANGWKAGNIDAPQPPEEAVRPGLGAFTFALRTPSHPIDVVAERAGQPMGAMLRNVTCMRGFAQAPTNGSELIRLRDHLPNSFGEALEFARLNGDPFPAPAQGRAPADEPWAAPLLEGREKIADAIGGLAFPEPGNLCPLLQDQIRRLLAPGRATAQAAIENLAARAVADVEHEIENLGTDEAKAAMRALLLDEPGGALPRLRGQLFKVLGAADEALGGASLVHNPFAFAAAEARRRVDRVYRDAGRAWIELRRAVDGLSWEVAVATEEFPEFIESCRDVRSRWVRALGGLDDAIDQAVRAWIAGLPDLLRVTLRQPIEFVEEQARALSAVVAQLEDFLEPGELDQEEYGLIREAVRQALEQARLAGRALRHEARAGIGALEDKARKLLNPLDDVLDPTQIAGAKKLVADFIAQLSQELNEAIDAAPDESALLAAARDLVGRMRERLTALLQQVEDEVARQADSFCDGLFPTAFQWAEHLLALFDEQRLKDILNDLMRHLPTEEDIRRRLQELETQLGGHVRRVYESAGRVLGEVARPALAAGDAVMRLLRAFGDPPRVPSLGFEVPGVDGLPKIGYYFAQLGSDLTKLLPRPAVDITPVLAAANELGQDVLNALQIKLPTTQLLERIVPFDLKNFDLRKIFPNFAGLKLDDLFENLKLPDVATRNVRITHGEDPQSFSGWVQIDADVPYGGQPAPVFDIAGLRMVIVKGRFQATSRLEAALGQGVRQTFRGELSGDWELVVGSFKLVVLEQCRLLFDDSGRVTFDIRPDKVRLPGPLQWISDLVSRIQFSDSGFTFKVTTEGVQIVLDLPLPDVQGGAFGLANLRLGFFFELLILPQFVIAAGVNVASREAPFTLTIFILGGAGWFDFRMRYLPAERDLLAQVSIGIMASASLAIALGPIKGGVYAYFGIVVDYTARTGRNSQLSVAIVLFFHGHVSVLGIISVDLTLGLEAQYTNGGGLVGRGYVSLRIKICWCFTLKVRASVQYRFGKSGGGGQARFGPAAADARSLAPRADRRGVARDAAARPTPDDFAQEYAGMFV